jgi:hypothetical protein
MCDPQTEISREGGFPFRCSAETPRVTRSQKGIRGVRCLKGKIPPCSTLVWMEPVTGGFDTVLNFSTEATSSCLLDLVEHLVGDFMKVHSGTRHYNPAFSPNYPCFSLSVFLN